MRTMLALALMLLVAGCAAPVADWGPKHPCPVSIREYSRDEQRRVADLLEANRVPDPLPRWIEDYGRLRAEVRAACGR
jgi:hypothetical protein